MEDQGFMNSKLYDSVGNFTALDSFSCQIYTTNPSFSDHSFQAPANFKEKEGINKNLSPNPRPEPTLLPNTQFVSSSNTFTISIGYLKPKEGNLSLCDSFGYAAVHTKKISTSMIRNLVQAQDHVLAERKRREMLTQRFISLSSLLPNLKKMDKASVLEDAATYIKELQERVKELEVLSGAKRKGAKELVIPVKILKLKSDNDVSSSGETNSEESSIPYKSSPEIEVRMSGSSVLVRIHSQKNSFLYMKVLREMQKVGLSISSSSVMPFSESTLLITIVAQMEDEFVITLTDLVKKLQLLFEHPMACNKEVKICT